MALTILVVGISVVAQGFSLSIHASSLARSRSLAARLAADLLVEIETSDLTRVVTESGDFGDEHPGFTWEAAVFETDLPELREARVAVRWLSRGQEREVGLTRLIHLPASSASVEGL